MFSLHASQASIVERANVYGEIIAAGTVKVDGLTAISGQTVFSGNSISTARNSSAAVIAGKLGRIELLSDSSVRLSFEEASLTALLDAGRMRLLIPAGVFMTVTTKDGTIVADDSQPSAFSISLEHDQTIVTTQTGRVYFHAEGKTRQVAAGQAATASRAGLSVNTAQPQSGGTQHFNGNTLAVLLLGIGSVIASAVFIITEGDNNMAAPAEEGTISIGPSPTK
jgi:ferric-dicitrate binding protein FerR (iron transport regulator)